jgi:type IV pilus assembly protein PilO
LRRFEQQNQILHDFYAEVPIQLDVVGTFHDLAMFFDRVSKFGRIVTVSEVSITAVTDAGTNTIQSLCTASTFYFLPESEVADPDAAATTGG